MTDRRDTEPLPDPCPAHSRKNNRRTIASRSYANNDFIVRRSAMTQIIPRSNPRTAYQAPIQYALLNTRQFRSTRTYDVSHNGLCYETDQPLDIESEVCIVMDNYVPGQDGPEGYRSYVARIRWMQLMSSNGTDRYAAGAQIVARSHEILATEDQMPHQICDLCGATKPAHRIETMENNLQLCRQCSRHFRSIPSDRIRHCVERYLLGNVI